MAENALLFIHSLTGIHTGTGSSIGVVDLPVRRERHTDWPTIPASSLKGVLRSELSSRYTPDDPTVLAAFGARLKDISDHSSALAVTDARLLAFPVRSLTGVFAWTTCPSVLGRFKRDLGLIGTAGFPVIPRVASNTVLCTQGSPLLTDNHAVLEEFEFKYAGDGGRASEIAGWLAMNAIEDEDSRERFESHLAILSDNDFTHFARHATEIVARIGLNYETKTVKKGALFYEEHVPSETLFYSIVMAEKSRRVDVNMSATDVLRWFETSLPKYLQIGGGESIGKGICSVRLNHAVSKEVSE